jgi:leader peptidase (prepilin peptidase)/N-methyltransferase
VLTAAAIVLGLFVGSYLGLVVDRLPAGESTASGRSRCDACRRTLRWFELVPVVSWVVLRGRCRTCGAHIAVTSTLIEAATALLFASMVWRFGWHWELGGYVVLVAALVALTVIDLRTRRLPREITYVAAGLGVPFLVAGALVADEPERLLWALAGGAGALVFFLVLHLGWRGAMGEGDVRLAALLGVFLGWIGPMHVPVGLFLGFVAGALAGVGVMVLGRSRSGRKTAIPFGPFMALGAVIVIWWGQPLIRLWLGD